LKEIYLPEQDTRNILFLVNQLETKEFSSHLHAYEIEVPLRPTKVIIRQSSLKYYLPLHLISYVGFQFERGTKYYVCPKYEYPSTE
jgi:hypothetical protein